MIKTNEHIKNAAPKHNMKLSLHYLSNFKHRDKNNLKK